LNAHHLVSLARRILEQEGRPVTRLRLDSRHEAETIKIRSVRLDKTLHVTTGAFPGNGKLAEVFVSGAKIGSDMDGLLREWSTLLSMALQHRMPLSDYAPNLQRNPDGSPQTVFGEIVDALVAEQRPEPIE
jgi:hypothetical protein